MRKDGLSTEEGFAMDHLVEAWNHFVNLERQHPGELIDFCDGIHKCQSVLMARILRRDYPEGYPIRK